MMWHDFVIPDNALEVIYNETNDSEIDPVVYAIQFCALVKNEVDLYENTEMIIQANYNPERYLKLINQIDQFRDKCVENCRKNYEIFGQRLKKILEDSLEISTMPKTKETIDKKFKIRKESIILRREIFDQNLIFLDKLGEKKIGSLVFIEPFCLDDFQIECIKYIF